MEGTDQGGRRGRGARIDLTGTMSHVTPQDGASAGGRGGPPAGASGWRRAGGFAGERRGEEGAADTAEAQETSACSTRRLHEMLDLECD